MLEAFKKHVRECGICEMMHDTIKTTSSSDSQVRLEFVLIGDGCCAIDYNTLQTLTPSGWRWICFGFEATARRGGDEQQIFCTVDFVKRD